MHLLFVCTGNTCRSPMAAAMARAKIAELGLPWTVSSAGLSAVDGLSMSPLSAQTLTRRHIPLPRHRSKKIETAMVEKADLVLCMTNSHASQLKRRFPKAAGKIHCLGSYLSEGHTRDIADPFGGSDETYERAAREIESALRALFDGLLQENGKSPENGKSGMNEESKGSTVDHDEEADGTDGEDNPPSSDKGGTIS